MLATGSGVASFSGFTFDGEGRPTYVIYTSTGTANKTFDSCTIENAKAGGYLVYNSNNSQNISIANSTLTATTTLNTAVSWAASMVSGSIASSTFSLNATRLVDSAAANSFSMSTSTISGTYTGQVIRHIGVGTVSLGGNTFTATAAGLVYASTTAATTFRSNNASTTLSAHFFEHAGSGSLAITSNTATTSFSSSADIVRYPGGGALSLSDNTFSVSGSPESLLQITGTGSGGITISGNSATYTSNSTAQIVYIVDGSHLVSVTNNTIRAQGSTQDYDIIFVRNQPSPNVMGNTIETINTTNSSVHIKIDSTGTNTGTVEVRNNVLRTTAQSEQVILVGTDLPSSGDNQLDGAIIDGNSIYGPRYYAQPTGGLHAIEYGYNKEGFIRHNYVNGSGYGIVVKGASENYATAGGVMHNLLINNSVSFIRVKGVINLPIYNNTFYLPSTSSVTNGIVHVTEGENVGDDSTGTLIKNNIFYGRDGYSHISVSNDGSSIGISNYNLFWNDAGSGMDYNAVGTTYSSFAAWQAAGYDTNSNSVNPVFQSIDDDFNLQYTSPSIDAGTNVSLTTDFLGNSIYGTPDIGAYEYQPPYIIGSNAIPATGAVRIYSNGEYRMTTASSTSATANLVITPVGGSFQSTTTEYMNTTISTWNISGDYAKTWTESSAVATSTVHTIGDLAANTYYTVNVDGVQYVATQSNGSGQISFTYSGGYSTHTFNISADTSGPLAFSPSSPSNNANVSSTQTFTWSATTDPSAGLSKYQLYVDGGLNQDNITGTSVSSSGFSCGTHTWYVRAIDNAGNGTNSDTYTFGVSCGGGPIMPQGTILFNTPTPRMQVITNGVVTYLDEKVSTSTPASSLGNPTSKLVAPSTTNTAPAFTRPLKRGSKGTDVTFLQMFLKKDSALYPEGLITGFFGPATERALKRFQKKYGIATPGVMGYGLVGPKTRAKLNALMGE